MTHSQFQVALEVGSAAGRRGERVDSIGVGEAFRQCTQAVAADARGRRAASHEPAAAAPTYPAGRALESTRCPGRSWEVDRTVLSATALAVNSTGQTHSKDDEKAGSRARSREKFHDRFCDLRPRPLVGHMYSS